MAKTKFGFWIVIVVIALAHSHRRTRAHQTKDRKHTVTYSFGEFWCLMPFADVYFFFASFCIQFNSISSFIWAIDINPTVFFPFIFLCSILLLLFCSARNSIVKSIRVFFYSRTFVFSAVSFSFDVLLLHFVVWRRFYEDFPCFFFLFCFSLFAFFAFIDVRVRSFKSHHDKSK